MNNRMINWVMTGILAVSGAAMADLLVEVDFSGSGGIATIPASDAQVTTHEVVNYEDTAVMNAVGSGTTVGGWNMDGTKAAAVNNDLGTGSTFGAPTRMDFFLGYADTDSSYQITSVEIVVRAAASTEKNWDFMYRDSNGDNQIISGTSIAVQSGAMDWTTYTIDLTSANLIATDSATSWDLSKDLRIGFWEDVGDNADNLQIDAVRFNGSVVPEPATLGMLGMGALLSMLLKRVRG